MNHAAIPAAQSTQRAMIPKSLPGWQQAIREAVSDPCELLALLKLEPADVGLAEAALQQFPMRIPRDYIRRMQVGNPHDPLLLQVLPAAAEDRPAVGFGADPVGDLDSSRGGGLLHKYPGRALLITTGACAIHCRYCFRRAFPYAEHHAGRHQWREALELIAQDPSIEEVILSGGDPLSLTDAKLSHLASALDAIPQLKRLRIHTRQPIVLPERVDDALINWLSAGRLQRIMVVHANHPNEINESVQSALVRLRENGVTLFNQSVLLKNINDDPKILADLCQAVFSCGVVPYYLHQLDRVQGAAHFEVSDTIAIQLHDELRAMLPGYLLPELVREIPGQASKTPLIRGLTT